MARRRDPYWAAGQSLRETLARAVAKGDQLKPRDWRVLGACFALVSSYSRSDDYVYVAQLAELAGVSRQRTSESLGRLDKLRIIEWCPSKRRRRDSYLNLGIRL